MAFPGMVGMDISRNDAIRAFDFTSFATCVLAMPKLWELALVFQGSGSARKNYENNC